MSTLKGRTLASRFRGALVVAALTAGFFHPSLAAADPPETIRILTWNTWMLPDLATPGHAGNLDNDRRLVNMAARINTGAYDVVVLNEVFNGAVEEGPYEDAIYLLTGKLADSVDKSWLDEQYDHLLPNPGDEPIKPRGQYLYYAYVPGFWTNTLGNSGLQAFTNFPPLPRQDMPFLAGLDELDGSGYNFFCFGRGEEELQDKQLALGGPTPPLSPWVMAPDFETTGERDCAGAFSWFTDAAGDDAGAIKGVGWLRVRNTKTRQPLNIVFTHTQADYPERGEEYVEVRARQLRQIREFIELMVPDDEDVVLAGDLNVLGDGDWLPPSSPVMNAIAAEYQAEIAGELGADGFADSFRRHLGVGDADWGYTRDRTKNPNNTPDPYPQRLDYILARWSQSRTWFEFEKCIQHVRVRRDFDIYKPYSQANMDASDHYPVEMTVGFRHGFCSPREAFNFASVPATAPNKLLTLDFAQPGSMQWVRVPAFTDLLATASMGVSSTGGPPSTIRLTAFKATDISMPVNIFGGKTELGEGGLEDLRHGAVLSFPFDIYVRIQASDKNFVGSANLQLTRLNGRNFDLALPIGMTGFEDDVTKDSAYYYTVWDNKWSRPVALAGTNIPGQTGQQEMWFRYNVDVLQPSLPHCVTINLLQNHALDENDPNVILTRKYKYALYDGEANLVQGFGPDLPMLTSGTSKPWQINISCDSSANLRYNKKSWDLRLRVKRGVQSNAEEKLRINITTDVRGARFLSLDNVTTNDPGPTSGDDEPAAKLVFDGQVIRMKAWGIEEGGGLVNWNYVVDPMPQGASQHHAQFKEYWSWRIGESYMSADSTWTESDVEWYTVHTDNGRHRFEATARGVTASSGGLYGSSASFEFSRFDYETGARMWGYNKTDSAPSPQMEIWVKAYMPGGIDMESEE